MSIPQYGYGATFFTEPLPLPVDESEKSSTEGSTPRFEEADDIDAAKYVSELVEENEVLRQQNIQHQENIKKLMDSNIEKDVVINDLQIENARLKQKNLLKKQKIKDKVDQILAMQRLADADRAEFRNAVTVMSQSVNNLTTEIRGARTVGYTALFLTVINVVSTSLNIFTAVKGICCTAPTIADKPA